MVNCINLIIEMSPRFILGRENVPCVAEVVNRSLKADCTDYMRIYKLMIQTPGGGRTPILGYIRDVRAARMGEFSRPKTCRWV